MPVKTELPYIIHEGEDYLQVYSVNPIGTDFDIFVIRNPSNQDKINADFLVKAANNHDELVELVESTVLFRQAQYNYFKTRTKEALIHSKSLEKAFDDKAAVMLERLKKLRRYE